MLKPSVDVILIGTGIAPLVAASRLLSEGAKVAILNPDRDFYLEDSEMELDPDPSFNPLKLEESRPEKILEALRPGFPGAVELWPPAGAEGFRDGSAPHVRSRSRLWVDPLPTSTKRLEFEEAFLRFEEKGWDARLHSGLSVSHRFPGHSHQGGENAMGLSVSGVGDIDVVRYRYGLLEYIRERIDPAHLSMGAYGIELIPEGVRFQVKGESKTLRAKNGVLVFWTPKLMSLVQSWISQRSRTQFEDSFPKGLRSWEEWSLVSRDPLEWENIGILGDLVAYADCEGAPIQDEEGFHRLSVWAPQAANEFVREKTFQKISGLCMDFLGWNGFSIRSVKPRSCYEWEPLISDPTKLTLPLSHGALKIGIVTRSDGVLSGVVERARIASEGFLS